jgi:predicted DNA-binding transcriptional regulator AlpA
MSAAPEKDYTMSDGTAEPEYRFLTKEQVCSITTLSPAEIARREDAGTFPRRRRLSKHPKGRVIWWYHEIVEWMKTFLA